MDAGRCTMTAIRHGNVWAWLVRDGRDISPSSSALRFGQAKTEAEYRHEGYMNPWYSPYTPTAKTDENDPAAATCVAVME